LWDKGESVKSRESGICRRYRETKIRTRSQISKEESKDTRHYLRIIK